MARIVFLLIATLACGDAYAQLDLNLGVSGSRSYHCLADFTDSGIGYGVRVEMAGDLNDRFQFIGNLSYDRHNSEYSSLPVMAGLRVSTTSDDDMFCYVQATAGSAYRVMGEGDNETAWVANAGIGTVWNRLGAIVEYNVSRDKWSWASFHTFIRLPLGF
ncbi:MAG: hypothetical protein F4Y38_01045 [Gemmatimonadetes bacterium]|nr:hypothetical protein [Gemmatimonadota bacterium]MYG85977.1 hypothetical protein [Gemmatimonadota bacterium]MYJ89349.1 hypothetical protein [Gemmatimonadota bacterium]